MITLSKKISVLILAIIILLSYNQALLVIDDYGNYTFSTIMLDVSNQLGDPYADNVVNSLSIYYYDGENSLGEPDGLTARIFSDYGVGYLTLDMGENEEILNDTGDDFFVLTESGEYTCWAGNNLDVDFQFVGIANASQSFDLTVVGLDSARYIRIQYSSGSYVELDALEAIYYNIPTDNGGTETPTNRTEFPLLISCLTAVSMLFVFGKNRKRKDENR